MTNHFKPSTTALALLKAGWRLTTPDDRFEIKRFKDQRLTFYVFDRKTETLYPCPLTAAGLEQAAERVNLPF